VVFKNLTAMLKEITVYSPPTYSPDCTA